MDDEELTARERLIEAIDKFGLVMNEHHETIHLVTQDAEFVVTITKVG